MVEFDVFVLKNKRGRVRFRARVAEHLLVDRYLSMREIDALGVNILMQRKQIEMTAFMPSVMLPLYDIAKDRRR